MVNITISLPDDTVKRLRRAVKERYGGRKGAISGLIREALEEKLGPQEVATLPTLFKAYDGEREVAEAPGLDALASALRGRKVDPRSVRIVSSAPLRQVIRAGLRGSRT
jgi:Arc/MetJ-type ribon-helix-helix transcriptional regulator